MLHAAGESVHRHGLCSLCRFDSGFGRFHDAGSLQSGDLDDSASELPGQLGGIDFVSVFLDYIHHVDGNHHGDAKLSQLRGQIKVPFKVGTVDDIKNRVGTFLDQVVPCHHFFERVRGERVYTGKVGDGNVIVLFQFAFLFFNRDSRPVANELIGTCESVEQRGFSAVRIARKGYSNIQR